MPRIADVLLYGFAMIGLATSLSYLFYWVQEVFL